MARTRRRTVKSWCVLPRMNPTCGTNIGSWPAPARAAISRPQEGPTVGSGSPGADPPGRRVTARIHQLRGLPLASRRFAPGDDVFLHAAENGARYRVVGALSADECLVRAERTDTTVLARLQPSDQHPEVLVVFTGLVDHGREAEDVMLDIDRTNVWIGWTTDHQVQELRRRIRLRYCVTPRDERVCRCLGRHGTRWSHETTWRIPDCGRSGFPSRGDLRRCIVNPLSKAKTPQLFATDRRHDRRPDRAGPGDGRRRPSRIGLPGFGPRSARRRCVAVPTTAWRLPQRRRG